MQLRTNGQREMESKANNNKSRATKGLWRPEEDMILKTYVEIHGEGNWTNVSAKSGLKRSGKSCRLRWKNYLRPDIKRGEMSMEETDLIIRMHKLLGNRWSLIAGRLPGRTDNEVKNYWNTHLSKTHQSAKRKTNDSDYCSRQKRKRGIRLHSNSEPSSCGFQGLESVPEQVDGEPQRINYHFGSPTHPDNIKNFVFDDEPFLAYLESFHLYEPTRQIEGEKNSQEMRHPQTP